MSIDFNLERRRLGGLLAAGSVLAVSGPLSAQARTGARCDGQAAGPAPDSTAWRAPPSTTVVREEIAFNSGDIRLAGTLFLPQGGADLGAVVVLHGASSPLRASPLYQHLTQMLPSLGIAVLLYDRRGSGASSGTREGASFEDLARDGLAAVDLLRKDRRIDPARIGVWGLSQGGWLSILAAQSPDVRFAVSISAPLVTPDVQMMFSSTNSLRVFGYSPQDIAEMQAARSAVDTYMRQGGDLAAVQRAVDAVRDKPWYRYLYMGRTIHDRATSDWRREIEHDPITAMAKVKAPLLVLFGATDPVVPVATSMERLAGIQSRLPAMKAVVIADADHGMEIGFDPRRLLDPDHDDESRPNAGEYFAVLANWLTSRGIARKA